MSHVENYLGPAIQILLTVLFAWLWYLAWFLPDRYTRMVKTVQESRPAWTPFRDFYSNPWHIKLALWMGRIILSIFLCGFASNVLIAILSLTGIFLR
jgi:hypothetical protein